MSNELSMAMKRLMTTTALLLALVACGGDPVEPGDDGGDPSMMDGGTTLLPDGNIVGPPDTGIDGNGACVISVEICGDHVDQNCDGRDTGCGDSDGDTIEACRAGDDLMRCDCDDSRADVRPVTASGVAGAPELCDGRDNDCNGRVDESAACCEGCASLGDNRERADICTLDGTCDCSTEPGIGACAEGETCCGMGCTNTDTDFSNCGFCFAVCTAASDTCTAGECRCGTGPVCEFINECTDGVCGM